MKRPSPPLAVQLILFQGFLFGIAIHLYLLRSVTLQFTFHPPPFGIVSPASLARYPAQQETFHLAAFLVVTLVTALGVGLLGWLRIRGRDGSRAPGSLASLAARSPVLAGPLVWVLFAAAPGKLTAVLVFGTALGLFLGPEPAAPGQDGGSGGIRDGLKRIGELGASGVLLFSEGLAVGFCAALLLPAPRSSPGHIALLAGGIAICAAGAIPAGERKAAVRRWARAGAPLLGLLVAPVAMLRDVPMVTFILVILGITFVWILRVRNDPGPPDDRLPGELLDHVVVPVLLALVCLDPGNAVRLVRGLDDLGTTPGGFPFLAEHGERLEWTARFMAGEFPGRDFFFLYGPFVLFLIKAVFLVIGPSHKALLLAFHLQDFLGCLCVFALARTLFRTRVFACLALFLTVPIYLRAGVGALGLALAALHLRTGRLWPVVAAGLGLGFSLMYSQEFGLAQIAASAAMMVVAAGPMAALRYGAVFGASALVLVLPVLWYLVQHGALDSVIRQVREYPMYMLAGFSKIPYDSFRGWMPLLTRVWVYLPAAGEFGLRFVTFFLLPLGYPLGFLYLTGKRISRGRLDPRDALVAGILVYGLVSFRVCLGHSCVGHSEAALFPAALLHGFLAEGLFLACLGDGSPGASRVLPRWAGNAMVLGSLLWIPVFLQGHSLFGRWDTQYRLHDGRSLRAVTGILSESLPVSTGPDREPLEVVRYIRANTRPDDFVLALPHGAAYYFFSGRRNPSRYAMMPLLITDEHRRDVLADVQRARPPLIVYDLGTARLDLPDHIQFPELMKWIFVHYVVRDRTGHTLMFVPANPAHGATRVIFRSTDELDRDITSGKVRPPFQLIWGI